MLRSILFILRHARALTCAATILAVASCSNVKITRPDPPTNIQALLRDPDRGQWPANELPYETPTVTLRYWDGTQLHGLDANGRQEVEGHVFELIPDGDRGRLVAVFIPLDLWVDPNPPPASPNAPVVAFIRATLEAHNTNPSVGFDIGLGLDLDFDNTLDEVWPPLP